MGSFTSSFALLKSITWASTGSNRCLERIFREKTPKRGESSYLTFDYGFQGHDYAQDEVLWSPIVHFQVQLGHGRCNLFLFLFSDTCFWSDWIGSWPENLSMNKDIDNNNNKDGSIVSFSLFFRILLIFVVFSSWLLYPPQIYVFFVYFEIYLILYQSTS